ncbi:MAG: hypothetical protein LC722_08150, partial [Actinobacteria bacterium]|nr:hypothetical protein [Actinomycetota bacterium]
MDYQAAVTRGRVLLKRSEDEQWELAELCYDITTGPAACPAEQYAADLGVSGRYVRRMRETWVRFGKDGRPSRTNLSFPDCYTLAAKSAPAGDELLARAKKSGRKVSTEERNGRGRDPVGEARETMRDREHAREVLDDDDARKVIEDELARRNGHRDQPPKAKPAQGDVEAFSLILDGFYRALGAAIDRHRSKADGRRLADLSGDFDVANGWL